MANTVPLDTRDLNTLRIPLSSIPHSELLDTGNRQSISLFEYTEPSSTPGSLPTTQRLHRAIETSGAESDVYIKQEEDDHMDHANSVQPIQQQNENNPPRSTLNIMPLAEYLKLNPYHPPQARAPTKSNPNNPTPAQQSKGNPMSISHFYEACQKRNIHPVITETEVAVQQFTASVTFGDITLSPSIVFANKKAARQNVCHMALEKLLSLDETDGAKTGEKRKASLDLGPGAGAAEQDADDENWIGTLQEYTQRLHLPNPTYTFHEHSDRHAVRLFACTVTFGTPPASQIFGDAQLSFPSKQRAKARAACEAVTLLRSQGRIAPRAVKRVKTVDVDGAVKFGHTGGLTRWLRGFGVSEGVGGMG